MGSNDAALRFHRGGPAGRARSHSAKSLAMEFVLLGFLELRHSRGLLLESLLPVHMVTILENRVIVVATPACFFPANVWFWGLWTSVTIRKPLADLLAPARTGPFSKILTQVFLFVWLDSSKHFPWRPPSPLATMACDQYLATCGPALPGHHGLKAPPAPGSWCLGG